MMKTENSEKRSVKTLKGQLFGAISMMLVAAIALGTSTYAWFINNQTVKVETVNLTVSTSTSMLVAVGKADGITTSDGTITKWTGDKSLVTNSDITGLQAGGTTPAIGDVADWADFLTNKMTPASVTDASLKLMKPTFYATNNHVSEGLLDEFTALGFDPAVATSVGQGAVKRIPLKFSASNDMAVYFGGETLTDITNLISATVGAPNVGTVTPADQATAIRSAIRVAIVPFTDTDYTATIKPIVLQFDTGAKFVTTNANNTDYNGQTASIDETTGKYSAIATVGSDKKIATIAPLTALVPGYTTVQTINANNTIALKQADGTYNAPAADGIPLFSLLANKPRQVDVYIWLEGTDQDCLNALSSYAFGLDLPFAAVLPTPAT